MRPLGENDWTEVRRLRLEALQSDPGLFFSSHAAELDRPPDDWRRLVSTPSQCVFGIFVDGELVGITAVFTHRDDATGQSALLGMSYLRAEHRGKGLARLLYDRRLDWIRARPRFRVAKVSHRASNVASERAILRSGFTLVGRVPRTWPDGTSEDELLYELKLG